MNTYASFSTKVVPRDDYDNYDRWCQRRYIEQGTQTHPDPPLPPLPIPSPPSLSPAPPRHSPHPPLHPPPEHLIRTTSKTATPVTAPKTSHDSVIPKGIKRLFATRIVSEYCFICKSLSYVNNLFVSISTKVDKRGKAKPKVVPPPPKKYSNFTELNK